jgi:outer membrane protein OmpA-like peptidoglycan-associated protein
VKLLNKYPLIKLEVAVYTDKDNISNTSQLGAQNMVNHLINRGISDKRLTVKLYGSYKSSEINNNSRLLNRRIDLKIISDNGGKELK